MISPQKKSLINKTFSWYQTYFALAKLGINCVHQLIIYIVISLFYSVNYMGFFLSFIFYTSKSLEQQKKKMWIHLLRYFFLIIYILAYWKLKRKSIYHVFFMLFSVFFQVVFCVFFVLFLFFFACKALFYKD